MLDKIDIKKLENLSHWMDSKFSIPGTKIRFGLDSIIGLIPGIGDTVTLTSAAYLIGVAHKAGLPLNAKIKMALNAFIDWFIGLIPLIGDLFDVAWKANNKNIEIIKKHLS